MVMNRDDKMFLATIVVIALCYLISMAIVYVYQIIWSFVGAWVACLQ